MAFKWSNIINGILTGGNSLLPDLANDALNKEGLFANEQSIYSDPLVAEALHTLNAYKAIAPEQLKVMGEFNPQFAKQYGKDMASIYEGTLPTYENLISPALSRVNSQQRGADIADVALYGPLARQSILNANPDSAKLLAKLNDQANAGLDAGSKLRPEDIYQITKRIKGDYSSRGFDSPMPASDLAQAMQLYLGGQDVQDKRRSFAGNVLGYNQQVVGDPFLQILGRSGQSVAAANNLYSQGQGQYAQSGAGQYDPFKDAYSTMFHQQDLNLASDNADKQLTGAVVGGLLGAAGSVGLGAMCWAAREVFGNERVQGPRSKVQGLKWLAFRRWLLLAAPEKLRAWYLDNGELWAERLRTNPLAKQVVKQWMERRIGGNASGPI